MFDTWKKFQTYSPKLVGFDGDESYGIPIRKETNHLKEIQAVLLQTAKVITLHKPLHMDLVKQVEIWIL